MHAHTHTHTHTRTAAIKQSLSDDHMKMLNLSHDWLVSLLPFVLGKINRVGYGLLSVEDMNKV